MRKEFNDYILGSQHCGVVSIQKDFSFSKTNTLIREITPTHMKLK